MKLVDIGLDNIVSAERIVAIVKPETAPIKRLIQDAKDNKIAIDATYGKRTKGVIIMDSGHIVLTPLIPSQLQKRIFEANELSSNSNLNKV